MTDIAFSVGMHARHAEGLEQVRGTFDDLVQRVKPNGLADKDGPYICGPLRGGRRNTESAEPVAFVALDLDRIADDMALAAIVEAADRWRGVGYTTFSHKPEAGINKARLIFALDREVTRAEYPRLCKAVATGLSYLAHVPVEIDTSCSKPEQPLYTARRGATVWQFDGEPVRVDQALLSVPDEPQRPSPLEGLKSNDPVLVALRDQGRVLRDMGGGKFAIRCPFEAEHSREHTGDDSSTVYLLPHTGGYLRGHFKCQHDHCAERTDAEFLAAVGIGTADEDVVTPEFSDDDAEAADDALRPVGFRSFVQALEPPTYAVDGLLIRGYCYSFTGPSGHGKTAIAMTLAAVKSVGDLFAGRETTAERVLYVAGENPDDVRMRALALAGALRLSPDVLEDRLQFIDRSFALGDRHAELMKVIEDGGFGMVILDTDQALSSDADENSNAERIEHAKRVRMLTKARPRPTVIDLCHPPINAGRNALRPRGGSAFLAEIDGNAGVWMDDGDTRAELFRTNKFRGPMFDPLLFDIKVIELAALADSKGRAMTTAIALPADEADTEADEAARRRRLALLADISLHPGSTVRERATRTGSPTTTVYRDLRYLLSKGAINEAMDGHEITPRGKKWLAAN